MNKKLLTLGAALTIFGTALTSCGNNTLVVSNDVLVVGMEANYQPFNWTTYTSSEHTLPIYGTNEYADGYDVAIAKYLSEETGKDVYVKRIVWDSLIPSLQQDEVNLVLAGMTDTPERRESIDFTNPYLTSDLAFLIRTEDMPEGYGTGPDDNLPFFTPRNQILAANTDKNINDNPRIFLKSILKPLKGLEIAFEYTFDKNIYDYHYYTGVTNMTSIQGGKDVYPSNDYLRKYKQYTDYDALEMCFMGLARKSRMPIAMPYKIGCGRGGGDWDKVVYPMICNVFKDNDVVLYKIQLV